MTELPHGTISLLFSDIEGSTELQRRLGDRYQEVVEEHRRLLEDAFAANGGTVVDRQTESFFVAFTRARNAVGAAVQAQRALAAHAWPDGAQVRVRMGIHAGDPEVAGDRYVGLAVSRAARISAVAHGGQVLVSSSARALLADDERQALRTLGAHRLKDFEAPEPISQLVIDGLPSRFPPLRTETGPTRRRWIALALAALVAAGVATVAVIARDSSSGLSELGPTSVGVVDPTTNRLVDEIELGFTSHLIAVGEGYVWVANPDGSVLVKIDPETREVVSRSAIAPEAVTTGLAVGRGAVWVAVLEGKKQFVLELGPELGERRREISFGERAGTLIVSGLNSLAVGEGAVWALDFTVGALWQIDPGRPSMRAANLDALSLAAGSGAVWVAGTDVVTKIDAQTGLELASIAVGSLGTAETSSIAIGEGGIWFATNATNRLWRIDPAENAATETVPVGLGSSAVAVGEGAAWVANSRDGTLTRVDPRSGETDTIRLGSPLGGVAAASGSVWTSPGEATG